MYERLIKKKGTRRFNGILKHYDDNNVLKLNLTAGKGASKQLQKDIDRIIHKIFKDIECVLIENGLEVKIKSTYRKNNKKIRGFIPYNCEKCGEDKKCMLLKNGQILCNDCMEAENGIC